MWWAVEDNLCLWLSVFRRLPQEFAAAFDYDVITAVL